MPVCYVCKFDFITANALHFHFKVSHSNASFSYTCGEKNCYRSYDTWNSLHEHLKSTHFLNFEKNANSLQTETYKNIHVSSAQVEQIKEIDNAIDTTIGATSSNLTSYFPYQDDEIRVFRESVYKEIEKFICKMYSNASFPRNIVDTILNDIQNYIFGNFIRALKTKILNTLHSVNASNDTVCDISDMLDILEHPVPNYLLTEYKRLRYFELSAEYISPKSYVIGNTLHVGRKTNRSGDSIVDVLGYYISLPSILKAFFQLPDALDSTLSYMKYCSKSDRFFNFIQGTLWKAKTRQFNETDIVLPLFVYYDDFEANNPLGAHTQKIGAVYSSVPCIPPECQASLENIFLTMLFDSNDRKAFGNEATFSPLIRDLNILKREGIIIQTSSCQIKIYFILGLLQGDNLGLNSICGFTESFISTHFCRICRSNREQTKSQTKEEIHLLRDIKNYENDVIKNNVRETGIKEECIFNKVDFFHVAENYYLDSMHDFLEGICHYEMIRILNHCSAMKYLDLDSFNFRLSMFDFGLIDNSNKPSNICAQQLTGNKLKMKASEMLCFVKIFGLLVGDLIPKDDLYWKLYLLLRDILAILQNKILSHNSSSILKVLIHEHHSLYLRLFKDDHLKPKHHFLVHYPGIIEKCGPLIHYSTMRCEGKHRQLKKSCYSNMSRKQICLSMAKKHQLNFCYRLKSNMSILPSPSYGPGEIINLHNYPYFRFLEPLMPSNMSNLCTRVNWIIYKGIRYSKTMVLVLNDKEDMYCPQFAEIDIILIHDCKPLYICFDLEQIGYNSHVKGWEITNCKTSVRFVSHSDLFQQFPVSIFTMSNSEKYIILD